MAALSRVCEWVQRGLQASGCDVPSLSERAHRTHNQNNIVVVHPWPCGALDLAPSRRVDSRPWTRMEHSVTRAPRMQGPPNWRVHRAAARLSNRRLQREIADLRCRAH